MANMAPGRETLEMSNLRSQRRFKREKKKRPKSNAVAYPIRFKTTKASISLSLNVIAFL